MENGDEREREIPSRPDVKVFGRVCLEDVKLMMAK